MSALTSALVPTYTCNRCRQVLTLPGPPIVNESRESQIGRVSAMLAEHLGVEHKQAMMQCQVSGLMFGGWLTWQQFRHNNAELQKESEKVRIATRGITRKIHMPDEAIEGQIHKHLPLLPEETRVTVISLLKGLRDTLEEHPPA